jgi:hypothetical protein
MNRDWVFHGRKPSREQSEAGLIDFWGISPTASGWLIMDHKEFSARGGRSGRGEAKRRSPEHYKRLAQLGVSARLRKFAASKGSGSIARDAIRGAL